MAVQGRIPLDVSRVCDCFRTTWGTQAGLCVLVKVWPSVTGFMLGGLISDEELLHYGPDADEPDFGSWTQVDARRWRR